MSNTDLDARVAALMEKADRFADERGESTRPVDSHIYRNYLEQAIRAELQKPALREPVKDRASIESSCRFIEQHIATRKCDHPAVSDCWRCNSVYLAKRMRDLLTAHGLQGRAKPATAKAELVDCGECRTQGCLAGQCRNAPAKPAQEEITDADLTNLWIRRPCIHGGQLMPQLIDFARACIRASKGEKT